MNAGHAAGHVQVLRLTARRNVQQLPCDLAPVAIELDVLEDARADGDDAADLVLGTSDSLGFVDRKASRVVTALLSGVRVLDVNAVLDFHICRWKER
jgi:hypothetical protein